MLVLIHLLPVRFARLTGMSIGVVEAELLSTLMAFHLQYDATLLIFFGLAKGFAAGALPQGWITLHLSETLILGKCSFVRQS